MNGNRALFLDRDGVLDELVFYPETGEWEAPRSLDDLRIRPGVLDALKAAQQAGWLLFIVTNQPSFAKGKCPLEALQAVHGQVLESLRGGGVKVTDAYVCFHHPDAVVDGYGTCQCRKPSPFFIRAAAAKYGLDLPRSWMIGDQDTDVETGRRAGCRTALIEYEHSAAKRGGLQPDLVERDLASLIRALNEAS